MAKVNTFGIIVFFLTISANSVVGKQVADNSGDSTIIRSFYDFIGTWECRGITKDRDGSWKTDTSHATWVWFELFDGNGIQDIYYAGVKPNQIDTAGKGGTNIRIYNEEEDLWYMAWFSTGFKKIEVFTAAGYPDKIVMEGTNAQGRSVRNIFSDISEKRFTWAQYWTFDQGKTWVDVAKIWCTRISENAAVKIIIH